MKTSKLIQSLRILSQEEMKQLQPFLRSPYYNTNSNIVKLYRVLSPHHPEFRSARLTRKKVFEKVFRSRAYAHQQLLNLMSEFNRLLERYLVIRQLEKEKMLQQKLLLRAYADRPGCYQAFIKKFQLMSKAMEDLPYRDEVYFQDKMDLNLAYYEHPDTRLQKDDKGTLAKVTRYFSAYQKLMEVKLKCAQNARDNTIQNQEKVDISANSENVLLILYQRLEKFQRSQKVENFKELFDVFQLNIQLLRPQDQGNILMILINYCTRQTNSGHSDFIYSALELYKLGLNYQSFLVHGKIQNTTFHNIVAAGSICQEFGWTKQFMNDYQEFLDVKKREATVAMGLGLWHFEKKEYDRAIDIMQYTFKEPLDMFKAKALLIRSWFELWTKDDQYFDLLWAQLEAFEKFTRRDQSLTTKLKTAFLKFIAYAKKLVYLAGTKDDLKKINVEINQETNIVFKKWLLSKTNQNK